MINIFNCRANRERMETVPPDFYIGRPSPLGNPFIIGKDGIREAVIWKYEKWLQKKVYEALFSNELQRMIKTYEEFGVVNLWCWCSPLPCHGDVIKKIIERKIKHGTYR